MDQVRSVEKINLSRTLARRPGIRNECSQMRTTVTPSCLSFRFTCRARVVFARIFATQYSRFATGMGRLHVGQPCQKHPSMKIATLSSGNQKSGRPTVDWSCIFQPLIPLRTKASRTLPSVERLTHRALLDLKEVNGTPRYVLGAPAQSHWLEQDELSALIDPDYPLLAVTIWEESQRQINEVPESLWAELRDRLRNRPAPELFRQAIISYCEDFQAQVAALATEGHFASSPELANAKQEAENSRRLLLQLTKYGLGLSREAVNLPVSVDVAVADTKRGNTTAYVNEEFLRQELSRRIAPEPVVVAAAVAPASRPLLIGAVDGSTRGGILSFLGEEGDFNVGHAPMIAINTAVGQVNRDLKVEGRTMPAFLRLPEKPEDMQRQDNRYTVMAKLLYPDMSDAQYMHSVWNAMDLIEAKAALQLLGRWEVPKARAEITGSDVVLRDGTVSAKSLPTARLYAA